MDNREKADSKEPALTSEPAEYTHATEPADPIDRIDPAEPIDRIDPAEPIDRIDPLEPMLRNEFLEPIDHDRRLVVRTLTFCRVTGRADRDVGQQAPAAQSARPLRRNHSQSAA